MLPFQPHHLSYGVCVTDYTYNRKCLFRLTTLNGCEHDMLCVIQTINCWSSIKNKRNVLHLPLGLMHVLDVFHNSRILIASFNDKTNCYFTSHLHFEHCFEWNHCQMTPNVVGVIVCVSPVHPSLKKKKPVQTPNRSIFWRMARCAYSAATRRDNTSKYPDIIARIPKVPPERVCACVR